MDRLEEDLLETRAELAASEDAAKKLSTFLRRSLSTVEAWLISA